MTDLEMFIDLETYITTFDYNDLTSIGEAFTRLKRITSYIGDIHVRIAETKLAGNQSTPEMSGLLADLNTAKVIQMAVETRIGELQADHRSQEIIATPQVLLGELAAYDGLFYDQFLGHLKAKYPNISWLARI